MLRGTLKINVLLQSHFSVNAMSNASAKAINSFPKAFYWYPGFVRYHECWMKAVVFICNRFKVSELRKFSVICCKRRVWKNFKGKWFFIQFWMQYVWFKVLLQVRQNGVWDKKKFYFVLSLLENHDWKFYLLLDQKFQQHSWCQGVHLLLKQTEYVII